MSGQPLSQRMDVLFGAMQSVMRFVFESGYARRVDDPNVSNFVFGNPHEMPLTRFVEALQRHATPQNKDWFAYKMSEEPARKAVAESLRALRGMPFEADDIHLTNGAFAAIAVTLRAVVDPGDEVIFVIPPWFFYETLILDAGGVPVRVGVQPETFDLDLEAIRAAITPRTRAIIVNSPHNPTGKIYPVETLQRLAALLAEMSERNGRTIYLLSDESYNRITFDGRAFVTPAAYYPNTFVLYTYGKVLLTPGQRIGYIALPPTMPDRELMRNALFVSQIVAGWSFPNALLQYALADLERMSIDIENLQHKRDWMVAALGEMGYDVHSPEGTFYLLPRSPLSDDWAFCERLAEHDILVLPGTVCEIPGYFRISLTASESMIERALPGFAAAMELAKKAQPA